jgi:hypothetical protein
MQILWHLDSYASAKGGPGSGGDRPALTATSKGDGAAVKLLGRITFRACVRPGLLPAQPTLSHDTEHRRRGEPCNRNDQHVECSGEEGQRSGMGKLLLRFSLPVGLSGTYRWTAGWRVRVMGYRRASS